MSALLDRLVALADREGSRPAAVAPGAAAAAPGAASGRRRRPPPALVLRAAGGLRSALLRLADRLVPPEVAMVERASAIITVVGIRTAARLGIADTLAEGPRTAADLARAAGVDARALHRVLRLLAGAGVFSLDSAGRFSNTRLSDVLRGRGHPRSVRGYAEFVSSAWALRAWAAFDRTVETGRSAFELVHGKTLWEYFAEHPEEGVVFDQGIGDLTRLCTPFVAAAYPFQRLRTVCDVAGGRGALLAEILAQHPQLRGVLFDQASVQQDTSLFEVLGVAGRVERVAGDFFERLPEGHDAYLLQNVLHDWDDERCAVILGVCRRAMLPGRKLLIIETVVEPNQTAADRARGDITMMAFCSDGRQRSAAEHRALLERTGFRLERVIAVASVDIIEGVAV
ncbi:methyltransferase [Sorangium sp. So ce1151]|uniref:methyltransferase n=1 Tax=Sorangium sp. So ce1151 TaxID=3133332 RepID=UPI003F623892